MKKVMLLATMLAMVLTAAAPALAQATAGNISAQYVDCSQVQAALSTQSGAAAGGTGNANGPASAVDNSATVAQELNISQSQVNGCLGGVNVSSDPSSSTMSSSSMMSGGSIMSSSSMVSSSAASVSATVSGASVAPSSSASSAVVALPNTGGASLFAIGAGVLLVGGGLLARRLIR